MRDLKPAPRLAPPRATIACLTATHGRLEPALSPRTVQRMLAGLALLLGLLFLRAYYADLDLFSGDHGPAEVFHDTRF